MLDPTKAMVARLLDVALSAEWVDDSELAEARAYLQDLTTEDWEALGIDGARAMTPAPVWKEQVRKQAPWERFYKGNELQGMPKPC